MKKIYFLITLLLTSIIVHAQNIAGNYINLCPGVQEHYHYLNSSGDYTYEWSAEGGTVLSGINNDGCWIIWSDKNVTHKAKLIVKKNGNVLTNQSLTVKVLSLKDETPEDFTKSKETVAPGDRTPITYAIPEMKFPQKHEIAEPVTLYEWVLPKGWSYNGTVSDGYTPIRTADYSIEVVPDECTGGEVKIRGLSYCHDSSESEWGIVEVSRGIGSITSSASSTICGNPQEITFSIPSISGATYQWTKPSGWTWTSSTNTNVVKVLPDGLSGGEISVVVNGCIDNQRKKTIQFFLWDPNEPDPSVSGSNIVCSSGSTYNLNNLPSGTTVTWTSSSNITFPSGNTGSSVNAKSYSLFSSGSGWIQATINTACGGVPLAQKEVWVGPPSKPYDISFFPREPCLNQTAYAIVRANNGEESNAHYDWRNTHIYIDQDASGREVRFQTLTRVHYTTYVRVKGTNECGSSPEYSKFLRVIDCGGGDIEPLSINPDLETDSLECSFTLSPDADKIDQLQTIQDNLEHSKLIANVAIYPNPTKDIINVQIPSDFLTDSNCSIEVYNTSGKLQLKQEATSSNNTLNVQNLPSGIYIVKLISDKEVITKKIVKQ